MYQGLEMKASFAAVGRWIKSLTNHTVAHLCSFASICLVVILSLKTWKWVENEVLAGLFWVKAPSVSRTELDIYNERQHRREKKCDQRK